MARQDLSGLRKRERERGLINAGLIRATSWVMIKTEIVSYPFPSFSTLWAGRDFSLIYLLPGCSLPGCSLPAGYAGPDRPVYDKLFIIKYFFFLSSVLGCSRSRASGRP
jgi:hypothetical protein